MYEEAWSKTLFLGSFFVLIARSSGCDENKTKQNKTNKKKKETNTLLYKEKYLVEKKEKSGNNNNGNWNTRYYHTV